jgi:hypothetical protein
MKFFCALVYVFLGSSNRQGVAQRPMAEQRNCHGGEVARLLQGIVEPRACRADRTVPQCARYIPTQFLMYSMYIHICMQMYTHTHTHTYIYIYIYIYIYSVQPSINK